MPGSAIPAQNWLGDIYFDKWIHIGMFIFLVVLTCWGYPRKNNGKNRHNVFLLIAAICLCYGVAMEFVQKYFVANRSFDIWDIVADAVGCGLGLLFSKRRGI